MADEPKQQSMTAEMIREKSTDQQQHVIAVFKGTEKPGWNSVLQAIGVACAYVISAFYEVAAQLAEANARDREAEVRAKSAEAFVAELAKAQSLVVPAVQVPRPKR